MRDSMLTALLSMDYPAEDMAHGALPIFIRSASRRSHHQQQPAIPPTEPTSFIFRYGLLQAEKILILLLHKPHIPTTE
jgi:hypothetical protein